MTPAGVGRFVVKSAAQGEREEAAGTERLSDDIIVIPAPGGQATKEAWRQVVDEHGEASWVQPVLSDEEGRERYPTGEVTVRFAEPLSAEDVLEFARSRGLRVQRRNVYQPDQVVLVPERPRDVYLPELCEDLERDRSVARAWLNTQSRYTRA